jgi:tetratricopeptide (TPR) repeat protein
LPLAEAWRDEDGDFPFVPRGLEAARICLLGEAPVDIVDAAVAAAVVYLFRRQEDARAALDLIQLALGAIDRQEGEPSPNFIILAADCAERIGEADVQIAILEQGLALNFDEEITLAPLLAAHAEATFPTDPDASFAALGRAAKLFAETNQERSLAMTMGQIADILTQRGETDEALRIRREEELPVYNRLSDVRSVAVKTGQIADILAGRGETDEALRIRREKQLPVYERLGDVRSVAVTMGKIADILAGRGETDEALRLHREEELPVYERLGDVRGRAVTMGKIAEILARRGETDEALRIHIEERLPVADALQDVNIVASARFKCAQIRIQRGGLESGESQPIADELGESFAINQKLQRADGIAISGHLLGQVLAMGGLTEQALEVLDVSAGAFEKLGMQDQVGEVRQLQEQIRANAADGTDGEDKK